jgi:phage-related minor tail protein
MPKDNETTTKFKVDISELKSNFQEAQRQIRLANSEFKAATAGMTDWGKSADGISAKLGQLNKTLDAQKKQLSSLEQQYELVVKTQGEDSKGAQELMIKINNQKAAIGNTEAQIKDYNSQLEHLVDETTETTKDVDKASEGFTVMKGVLADLIAKGIELAIASLKDLASAAKDAYVEFDKGSDNLIKATGATGESAKQLRDVYSNVTKNVVGDMGDIGSAVGEVNTRFGLQGDELEELSTTYLKFADITGTDVVKAVDDTQKAMSAYGLTVEDAEHFLDVLAKTSQDTGVSTDKLNAGIISNATAFQELGLTADQAVVFMGQLEKSGANSETVLNGMRKALKNSAAEGLDLNESLIALQKAIENDTDGVSGLNAAYDLFGKSGDQIYGAIKNGTLSFEDLTTAAIDADGAVRNTYEATQDGFDKAALVIQGIKTDLANLVRDIMDKYGPEIEAVLEKVKEGISQAFDYFINTIVPKVQDGINWIIKHLPEIKALAVAVGAAFLTWKVASIITTVTTALAGMSAAEVVAAAKTKLLNTALLSNPIALVVAAIAALVAGFVTLWNTSEDFRNFWIGLWESIQETLEGFFDAWVEGWNTIEEFFSEIWTAITETITGAFAAIGEAMVAGYEAIVEVWSVAVDFFTGIWENIKKTYSAVTKWFKDLFSKAWNGIKSVWNAVTGYFKNIWDTIKKTYSEVASVISGFFSKAWDGVKMVWDTVVQYFTDVWDGIKLVFSVVESVLKGDFEGAWKQIKKIWDKVVGYFTDIWESIKKLFSPVKDWFKDNFGDAWKAIADVWDKVKGYFDDIWTGITNTFSVAIQWFSDTFGGAWNKIKEIFSLDGVKKEFDDVWKTIKDAFPDVISWFTQKFNDAWTGIKNAFGNVGSFFGGIWDGIKNKFTYVGTMVADAIGGAFKSAINAVIGVIEGALNKIPDAINGALTYINMLPMVDIGPMSRISLPRLAKGGILKAGEIGLLEGTGAEAVVPLEKNTGWLNEIAKRLSTEMGIGGAGGSGSKSMTVTNNFYQTNNSPKALDRLTIYRQSKNLLRMKG